MQIIEINCKTGKEIIREATLEEEERFTKFRDYIPGQDNNETLAK